MLFGQNIAIYIGCLPILPAVHIIININTRKIYNVEVIDDNIRKIYVFPCTYKMHFLAYFTPYKRLYIYICTHTQITSFSHIGINHVLRGKLENIALSSTQHSVTVCRVSYRYRLGG